MKRFLGKIAYLAVIAATAAGCAKEKETPANSEEKMYFEAWMQTHHPDAQKSGNGIYIIGDTPGNGEEVADSQYVYTSYTTTDLSGAITDYTEAETAKMLGKYDKTKFYGPRIMSRYSGYMYAGVVDMLSGMKQGGVRKAVVPGWLMTKTWYGTEQEYIDNVSGSNSIIELEVIDPIKDIDKWQIDSIGRFIMKDKAEMNKDFGYLDFKEIFAKNDTVKDQSDSTSYGFYYLGIKDGKPLDTKNDKGEEMDITNGSHFFTRSGSTDTTIYINYVGRLLNGLVFDTNVERVAQDNGLSGGTYEPVAIQWGDDYSELIMGTDSETSNIIKGFAKTLWQMHPFEKGIGIFHAGLGYGIQGSGDVIPSFSPLMFEIEIVEKPQE